ncbi:MAG: hypothetical protein ACHQIH_04960, partial [Ignavibacteria bacterium]
MNKILLSIALIFTVTLSVHSQNGWVWQNPLPQGNDMFDLELVNSTTAYALCFNSVMKSTNSGNNWSIYYTPPGQINTSMHFINASMGFIVCDTGMVL